MSLRSALVPVFAACAVATTLVVSLAAQQPVQTPPAPADPPPVTFRLEVNYVEVDAIVTDAQGRFVPGLTASDFELVEDGRPQNVTAFSLVNIPVERAERPLFATAPIEPDVQTNAGNDGRLYLMVLDTLHTSPFNALRVKAAARQFIERDLGDNDMAAVVFTQGLSTASQDFTNNRRLLLDAIDKFTGMKSPGATLSTIEDLKMRIGRVPGDPVRDPIEFERAYNARSTMDRIRTLSNFLAGVRGRRKAMLLIGEGVEYDFNDILGNTAASGVLESVRDAIGAATRANVAIYTIDPRGLTDPGADLIVSNSNPGADDRSLGNLGSRSIAKEFQRSQDSLRQLAEDTGGFAVLNRNDFGDAFRRIVRDNSAYYVLGYYPTNERRDGRFRRITVRTTRPGLVVRARRGYVAPRGKATENAAPAKGPTDPVKVAVNEALSSPLPVAGIPMAFFAAPIKGEAPNAKVAFAVELGVKGFGVSQQNGTFTDKLELAFVASDVEGKTRANGVHTVSLALKPDTWQRAQTDGLRVISEADLPPGRYQVRVAVSEAGAGLTGSVVADLVVPDFYKAPLTMSGLALTAASALDGVTVKPKDPLGSLLPAPITATRTFARNDTLALFAEFYENLPANTPAHKIDITTTIRTDEGRVVLQNSEERESGDLQGGRGGFGFTTQVPLAELAPGLYVLHVEGRSRATKVEAGVGRDIQFRVR